MKETEKQKKKKFIQLNIFVLITECADEIQLKKTN